MRKITGKPVLIGICGGSASGKTTVAKNIQEEFGKSRIVVIEQDNYYKGWGHLPMRERERINFDRPEAFDMALLIKHLKRLLNGKSIDMPLYCFKTHTRKKKALQVKPKEVIILEGIFAFANKALRNLINLKIYVEADRDICFIRRLRRDIKLRSETVNSVVKRYLKQVRPMQRRYIEPAKRYADRLISEENGCSKIGQVLGEVRELLKG